MAEFLPDEETGGFKNADDNIYVFISNDDSISIVDSWGQGVDIENKDDYSSLLKAMEKLAERLGWQELKE